MIFKKLFTVGILASLPLIANADLTISNQTSHDSTVKIGVMCSMNPLNPDGYTPAGQTRTYESWKIGALCSGVCTALVFPNANCSGAPIGSVTINSGSDVVTPAGGFTDGYNLTGYGGNSVTLTGP